MDYTLKYFFSLFLLSMIFNTYQIYKGKFFLGDSGTLFLGSLIGFLTIYIYNYQLNQNKIISIEKIFLLFIIPGVDMFRLFLQRTLNKKDPFSGDLNHLHHYILKKYSLESTLLIYWSSIIFLIIISYFYENTFHIIILYIISYVIFIYKLKN